MAKGKSQRGLGAKGWIDRAVAKYGSVKAVAEKLGRSPSTISDIRSGKRPGANLRDAARDLAQGKRAPVKAPPSKGRPEPQSKGKKLLSKAAAKLRRMDERGVDKVVIYINRPGAGKSLTLGAHGGVAIDTIYREGGGSDGGSFGGFAMGLAGSQGYELDDDDWDYVDSIEFEEYY